MKGKLKNSFFGAFGLLGAVLAVAVLGGFLGSGGARSRVETLARIQQLRFKAAVLAKNCLELDQALGGYLRSGDEQLRERFETALAETKAGLTELAGMNQKELQRERVKTAASLLDQWAAESALPQAEARKRLSAVRVGALVDPAKGEKLMKDTRGLLEEYVAGAGSEAADANAAAMAAFGRLNLMVLAGGLLAGAVAAGILFHLLRTVVRPIEGILAWFEAMRAGKPFTLEIVAANEISDVADAFLRVGEELRHARKEAEQLSMMPEASPLPILEIKADGSVVYANPAARKLAQDASITPAELLPGEAVKQLGELAGKEAMLRRERSLGDTRYDFVFRSAADKDVLFAVGFPKPAKKA